MIDFRYKNIAGMAGQRPTRYHSPWRRAVRRWKRLPVRNGRLALLLLNLAVLMAGFESAYVQAITTYHHISRELFGTTSFLLLLCLDILVPLIVALLSRRAFMLLLVVQFFLSVILLHYTIFFYNPLTLATIYHSAQGAASLGLDVFGFARPNIIIAVGALFVIKMLLVQLSNVPDRRMPAFWNMRGLTAVGCMAVVFLISMFIYGKTGLTVLWVDSRGHRTATERRLAEGTRETVRTIGYVGTWIGEWLSGTYRDTVLIYNETRCEDPDTQRPLCTPDASADMDWNGLPVPPLGKTVVMIQAESLDFAALGMKVNGHPVLPFLDFLSKESLLLKTFAPHKVGSSNSDYELLNGRVADQNVIYYSYIKQYPDSVIHLLADKGYQPALFHGLEGSLFNLRNAYKAQGFSRMFFKEELEDQGYKPGRYIMKHILDENVFDCAMAQLRPGELQAQFIITMTSHVPFIDPMPFFRAAGGSFARYVSSLRYLDQCLAAYYAQLPEGTLLIVWSDHGSDVTYPRGFPENSRHVPFMVHIKGNSQWLQGPPQAPEQPAYPARLYGEGAQALQREAQEQGGAGGHTLDRLLTAGQDVEQALVDRTRIYNLCELHFYLRRVFE